jgi:hypothetical protein
MNILYGNTVTFADMGIKYDGPKHFYIYHSTSWNNSDLMVDINLEDGTIHFGARYTPTLAAETFWESISGEYKDYLKWKRDRTK